MPLVRLFGPFKYSKVEISAYRARIPLLDKPVEASAKVLGFLCGSVFTAEQRPLKGLLQASRSENPAVEVIQGMCW